MFAQVGHQLGHGQVGKTPAMPFLQ